MPSKTPIGFAKKKGAQAKATEARMGSLGGKLADIASHDMDDEEMAEAEAAAARSDDEEEAAEDDEFEAGKAWCHP